MRNAPSRLLASGVRSAEFTSKSTSAFTVTVVPAAVCFSVPSDGGMVGAAVVGATVVVVTAGWLPVATLASSPPPLRERERRATGDHEGEHGAGDDQRPATVATTASVFTVGNRLVGDRRRHRGRRRRPHLHGCRAAAGGSGSGSGSGLNSGAFGRIHAMVSPKSISDSS